MAVNFGDTLMEGEITPAAKVQQPVQDDSGAVMAQAMAPAAKFLGGALGGIFKAGQEDANRSVLVRYENDLLDLAELAEQGRDMSEVMTMARNLRREYLAGSPALQEDFDKIWGNVVNNNGMGTVIVEGTRQQQNQQAVADEAYKAGYENVDQYRRTQSFGIQLKALQDQVAYTQSQGQMITETQKNQFIQTSTGLATSAYPAARKQINDAIAMIEANPSQKDQIVQTTVNAIQTQVSELQALTGGLGAAYINEPIEALLATFREQMTGTVSTEVLKNQLEYTQLQYDAMYGNDPILGPFIAQSNLLKQVGLNDSQIAQSLLSPEVIKRLRDVTDPTVNANLLQNNAANDRFASEFIKTMALEGMDEMGTQELKQALAGVIDGSYINERGAQDGAMGWKNIVEILGSPEAAEFVKANGPIPAQHQGALVDVIRNNYEAELIPVIQQYWGSVPIQNPQAGETVGMENIPMSQLLKPVWNGSVVEFVPNDAYADNPRVRSIAQDVNTGANSIGVPLNDAIRAHALLTGENAKTVWETQFAGVVFGIGPDGEAAPIADRVNNVLNAPVVQGNINTANRPVVNNADGTVSTEQSFSINEDGLEVLIPSVVNGKVVSEEQAIQHYERTGEHLGKFSSVEAADSFAEALHNEQEVRTSDSFSMGDFNPDTLEPLQEYTQQASSLEMNAQLPPIDPAYTNVDGINYDEYLPSIRSAESGGNDSAKNPSSTATGRYQFLKSTWDGLVNKYPNSGLTFDGRLNGQQQEIAIRLFTAENARTLSNNNISLSNGTLYAAHFLGASDAVRALQAAPSTPMTSIVPARVIDANRFLRNMTAADFRAWANRKGNM